MYCISKTSDTSSKHHWGYYQPKEGASPYIINWTLTDSPSKFSVLGSQRNSQKCCSRANDHSQRAKWRQIIFFFFFLQRNQYTVYSNTIAYIWPPFCFLCHTFSCYLQILEIFLSGSWVFSYSSWLWYNTFVTKRKKTLMSTAEKHDYLYTTDRFKKVPLLTVLWLTAFLGAFKVNNNVWSQFHANDPIRHTYTGKMLTRSINTVL